LTIALLVSADVELYILGEEDSFIEERRFALVSISVTNLSDLRFSFFSSDFGGSERTVASFFAAIASVGVLVVEGPRKASRTELLLRIDGEEANDFRRSVPVGFL